MKVIPGGAIAAPSRSEVPLHESVMAVFKASLVLRRPPQSVGRPRPQVGHDELYPAHPRGVAWRRFFVAGLYAAAAPLALALIAITAGCKDADANAKGGPGGQGPPQDPVTVRLATAERRPVQRTVEVVGTLWGEEDVAISNKVPGKVIAVFKDVGDRAEPGEVLAQLLKNDYELARNQRESALQEVLAKLAVNAVPPADFDPKDLPTVRRARLQAANAQERYRRGKQLHDQRPPLMSDQDFADLVTTRDVAQSAYDVEVLTARSLVAEARTREAELRIAEQALKDTTIRAPRPFPVDATGGDGDADGATGPAAPPAGDGDAASAEAETFAVAGRQIEVGELLSPLTPMFRLLDDDPLKLRADVPERFVGEVKVGQGVELAVEQHPGKTFAGKVSRINPQIDAASRTFKVEVVIPNPGRELRAGGFARAKIGTRTEEAVFVPAAAVSRFAGVEKVFTVKDGKAAEVGVTLGPTRTGETVEITKGLKGGEQVVAQNAGKLATGVPVTVTEGPAAAGADAPKAEPAAEPTASGAP